MRRELVQSIFLVKSASHIYIDFLNVIRSCPNTEETAA